MTWRDATRVLAEFGVRAARMAVDAARASGWTPHQILQLVAQALQPHPGDLHVGGRYHRYVSAGAVWFHLRQQPAGTPLPADLPERRDDEWKDARQRAGAVEAQRAAERRLRGDQAAREQARQALANLEHRYGAVLDGLSSAELADLLRTCTPEVRSYVQAKGVTPTVRGPLLAALERVRCDPQLRQPSGP